MSDFAAQEESPMKLRGNKGLEPPKGEMKHENNKLKHEENDVLASNPNDIRRVSWAEGSPQHRRILDSGLTNENACQSCANESRDRPMHHVGYSGRMSLPVNGKYANNYNRKTNGVEANAGAHHLLGKVNGLSPQLNNEHRSRSGNINCCGSSLRRAFQQRDPEKPWKSKGDYFVAVLTYLLGVGNVIRFPQLCFKHGGGKEWMYFEF